MFAVPSLFINLTPKANAKFLFIFFAITGLNSIVFRVNSFAPASGITSSHLFERPAGYVIENPNLHPFMSREAK